MGEKVLCVECSADLCIHGYCPNCESGTCGECVENQVASSESDFVGEE